MEDLLKGIGVAVLLILVAAILIVALWGAFYPFLLAICNEQTKDIGIPHKYSFLGGCLVQENGNWIPLDNWRYVGNK